jgi:hypothetical protein
MGAKEYNNSSIKTALVIDLVAKLHISRKLSKFFLQKQRFSQQIGPKIVKGCYLRKISFEMFFLFKKKSYLCTRKTAKRPTMVR